MTGQAARILVIRLGALGDFVQSFGPFAAIRAHHPDAHITLLTTRPFAGLAERAPWFDAVRIDARPPVWNLPGLLALRRALRGFDLVYDLQTSARSNRYFALAGRPRWSGIAPGCALPHANANRDLMHTRERQREQLEMAGIANFPRPALGWLAEGAEPALPDRAVLLVPGAAPHRPRKRWPADRFGVLAGKLVARGYAPVVIGSSADMPLAKAIRAVCPEAVDLTCRTSVADIFRLGARAVLAVGNDTGPMHMAAAMGCPCLVLFSAESDPALTSPRGPDGRWPTVLRVDDLATLSVDRVAGALP